MTWNDGLLLLIVLALVPIAFMGIAILIDLIVFVFAFIAAGIAWVGRGINNRVRRSQGWE